MIGRILFGLFELTGIFEKSRHSELEEFRSHQRGAIVASCAAVAFLLLALLFGPSEPGTFGQYDSLVTAVQWPIAVAFAGISVVACLVAMWKAYCLWKYEAGFQ